MPKRKAASKQEKPEKSRGTNNNHKPIRPVGNPASVASKDTCKVSDKFQVVKQNGKIFLSRESFPSYVEDDVWAILQDCGFYYVHGFRHDELKLARIDHEDDVRRQLVGIGLPPNVEEQVEEQDDLVKLTRWVACAHVPLKESDASTVLKTLPLPSDYQALLWLGKLGFEVDGKTGQIYRVRGDGAMEEYDTVEEVRVFVRAADSERLLGAAAGDVFSPRKRARRTTRKEDMPLSDEDMLALRLWGALSPTPLPVFGEEKQVAKRPVAMDIDDEGEGKQAKKKAVKEQGNEEQAPDKAPEAASKATVEEAKKQSAKPAAKAPPKEQQQQTEKKKPGRPRKVKDDKGPAKGTQQTEKKKPGRPPRKARDEKSPAKETQQTTSQTEKKKPGRPRKVKDDEEVDTEDNAGGRASPRVRASCRVSKRLKDAESTPAKSPAKKSDKKPAANAKVAPKRKSDEKDKETSVEPTPREEGKLTEPDADGKPAAKAGSSDEVVDKPTPTEKETVVPSSAPVVESPKVLSPDQPPMENPPDAEMMVVEDAAQSTPENSSSTIDAYVMNDARNINSSQPVPPQQEASSCIIL